MERSEAVKTLAEKIKGINTVMYATIAKEQYIHARPMAVQQMEFDGDFWFMTSEESTKIHEIEKDSHVNLTFVDHGKSTYVSVSGKAMIIKDQQKIDELWNDFYKAWFPKGKEDPSIRLIKVQVDSAEYWDVPGGKMAMITGFIKSLVTGKPADDIGENEELKL
ncbi:MAG: pyridoxamine 5'-phosphate oxidase family protein [Candidatus Gracilibacteria bacterium]